MSLIAVSPAVKSKRYGYKLNTCIIYLLEKETKKIAKDE